MDSSFSKLNSSSLLLAMLYSFLQYFRNVVVVNVHRRRGVSLLQGRPGLLAINVYMSDDKNLLLVTLSIRD